MAFTPPIEGVDNRRAIYGKFSAGIEGIESGLIGALVYYDSELPPAGWLEANGGECPAEAPALDAILNGRHGVGPNNRSLLPDVRGEFMRGVDSGRGVDVGRVLGSFQWDQNKAHTHSINLNSYLSGMPSGSGAGTGVQTGVVVGESGGNESRPRNRAFLACIYAGI